MSNIKYLSQFFYSNDGYLGIWFELADVYDSLNVSWKWYKPNGELFGKCDHITDWPTNSYWSNFKAWRFLDITGLTDYGTWKVELYINDSKIDTQLFTLNYPGGGGSPTVTDPPQAPRNLRIITH